MGKPLMIQADDEKKIDALKVRLHAKTKIQVVRAGLALLEAQIDRQEKAEKWKKAAATVATSSARINAEFRPQSRIKKL